MDRSKLRWRVTTNEDFGLFACRSFILGITKECGFRPNTLDNSDFTSLFFFYKVSTTLSESTVTAVSGQLDQTWKERHAAHIPDCTDVLIPHCDTLKSNISHMDALWFHNESLRFMLQFTRRARDCNDYLKSTDTHWFYYESAVHVSRLDVNIFRGTSYSRRAVWHCNQHRPTCLPVAPHQRPVRNFRHPLLCWACPHPTWTQVYTHIHIHRCVYLETKKIINIWIYKYVYKKKTDETPFVRDWISTWPSWQPRMPRMGIQNAVHEWRCWYEWSGIGYKMSWSGRDWGEG